VALSRSDQSILQNLIYQQKHLLFSVGIFSAFVNLLMLTGPLFMLQLYDRVLASRSESTLVALVGIATFLFLVMGLLDHARARVLARVGQRVQMDMFPRAVRSLVKLSLHTGRRSEAIASQKDLEKMQQFLSGPSMYVFFDLPWTPVFIAILFIFHWLLGVQAILSALLIVVLVIINQLRTRKLGEESTKKTGVLHQFLSQVLHGAETVQGLGMNDTVNQRVVDLNADTASKKIVALDRGGAYSVSSRTLRLYLQSMMLGTGAWLAIRDEVTAGTMIAATIMLGRALAPVDLAIAQWPVLQSARKAQQNLNALFEETMRNDPPLTLPPPIASLEARDLTVVPPGGTEASVNNVSFALEPGKVFGLVGPPGSGKSTLARALVGIWPAASGSVMLGGVEHSQYDSDSLGRYIGWLPQEVFLFDGTVADNISRLETQLAFESENSSDVSDATDYQMQAGAEPSSLIESRILEASRLAGVHEMILSLPDGYNFRIGNNGSMLSGGQRQRIVLARAFYRNALIYILDEPDAHLDDYAIEQLTLTISTLSSQGRSFLIISNRRGTLKVCDQIFVMKNSRFSGTYDLAADKLVELSKSH